MGMGLHLFFAQLPSTISGQAKITIFGKRAESLQKKVVYIINHIYSGNYKAKKIIKPTDVLVIEKKNVEQDFDIIERSVETSIKKIKCNLAISDLKAIISKTLSPCCKTEVMKEEEKYSYLRTVFGNDYQGSI